MQSTKVYSRSTKVYSPSTKVYFQSTSILSNYTSILSKNKRLLWKYKSILWRKNPKTRLLRVLFDSIDFLALFGVYAGIILWLFFFLHPKSWVGLKIHDFPDVNWWVDDWGAAIPKIYIETTFNRLKVPYIHLHCQVNQPFILKGFCKVKIDPRGRWYKSLIPLWTRMLSIKFPWSGAVGCGVQVFFVSAFVPSKSFEATGF